MSSHGLYWLSSYPKSGNTWFRIFLANVLYGTSDINCVDGLIHDEISTSRTWLDKACGFDTALLSDDEVDALKPAIYTAYAANSGISYHKTHKAYTYLEQGQALLPREGCLGAVYFIRNPLDVVVSLAHHLMCPIDKAIDIMGNRHFALHAFPLRQWLLSWSLHVQSWLDAQHLSCLFLRYEDMVLAPEQTFSKALQFLNLDIEPARIRKAIDDSMFDKLQRLEQERGFYEKPPKLERFFRKGIIGDWKNQLNASQIQRIIRDHGELMQAFDYGVECG